MNLASLRQRVEKQMIHRENLGEVLSLTDGYNRQSDDVFHSVKLKYQHLSGTQPVAAEWL